MAVSLVACSSGPVADAAKQTSSETGLEADNYHQELAVYLDDARGAAVDLRDSLAAAAGAENVVRRVDSVRDRIGGGRKALTRLWEHLRAVDADRFHEDRRRIERCLEEAEAKLRALEEAIRASDAKTAAADAEQIVEQLTLAERIHADIRNGRP